MSEAFWQPDGAEGVLYAPNPYDVVKIDKELIPGRCEVSAKAQRKKDTKSGAGTDGGTTTTTGYQPTEVSLSVSIWTPEQWAVWQPMMARLWPRVGKGQPQVHTIYHPDLAILGISQVVVLSLSTPENGSVKGERVFKLNLIEYVAPQRRKSNRKVIVTPGVIPEFMMRQVNQDDDKSPWVLPDGYFVMSDNVPQPPPSSTDIGPLRSGG